MTHRAGSLTLALLTGTALWLTLSAPVGAQAVRRPAGWSDTTHGQSVRPDYRRLFALDRVHELRISIPPDRFNEMQADLKTIGPAGMPGLGPGGPGGAGRPGGPGGFDPNQMAAMFEAASLACEGKMQGAACSATGIDGTCTPMFGGPLACVPEAMANMMLGGAINLTTRDPIYVPVTVTYDGRIWTKVGMRYKGNSSLVTASGSGNGKVPFRLDFERYEKDDPSIDGQRFFGFRELTFSSNFADDSQLREVLGAEIFRDRGVPAPRAAFYRIFVDTGAGPVYWGLYTMIEDPGDGAMLDAQLGGREGNLYKPDGPGADWTRFAKEGFPKKTNERADDYRDVEAAIAALHAPRADAAAWRARLESVFDVNQFLKWLAVNTAIENWDTYGAMAHNYYLYANPKAGGRLQWIPWDNNMAFGVGAGGAGMRIGGPGGPPPGRGFVFLGGGPPPGGPGAGPGGRPGGPPGFFGGRFGGAGDVLHSNPGAQWPLLQFLLADDVYKARYRRELEASLGGLMAPDAFAKRARELHALIASSVSGPNGERPTHTTVSSDDAFQNAVTGPGGLIEVVQKRRETIRTALAAVPGRSGP